MPNCESWAKGYIVPEKETLGNRLRLYQLTPKGAKWAKSRGLKVKHFESGPIHEYLLDQAEKRIGALNPQFKFQRNSEIAREYGIQPDLLLIQPQGHRAIIESICCNVDREAKTLVKARSIAGVDVVIAIVSNRRVKKALQCALEKCQIEDSDNTKLAKLVVLHAGECLSVKFDWRSLFEQP